MIIYTIKYKLNGNWITHDETIRDTNIVAAKSCACYILKQAGISYEEFKLILPETGACKY